MSREKNRRLALIEVRLPVKKAPDLAARARLAAEFKLHILKLAERFAGSESELSESDRNERFSKAQHLAWAYRFGTAEQFQTSVDRLKGYAQRSSSTANLQGPRL